MRQFVRSVTDKTPHFSQSIFGVDFHNINIYNIFALFISDTHHLCMVPDFYRPQMKYFVFSILGFTLTMLNVKLKGEVSTSFPRYCIVERSRNTVLVTSTQVHYLSHRTVQYGAHSFGSDKLYICLSNKCFKVYPAYSLCVTDVRPSQDHRILRMCNRQINLELCYI